MGRPVQQNGTLVGLTVGIEEIADLFGVSRESISRWCKDEGMPKAGHGVYDVRACVQWRLRAVEGDEDDALREERRKLVMEQRRGYELENARKAGELLPAAEVETDILAFAGIVASQLDALPQRVAPRLVGLDDPLLAQRVLTDECRRIRDAASEAFTAYRIQLEGGFDPTPAAATKRGRVGRRVSTTPGRESGAGAVADQ